MELFLLSKSDSLVKHIEASLPKSLDLQIIQSAKELPSKGKSASIFLVHADSLQEPIAPILDKISQNPKWLIGIASNEPLVDELLRFSAWDIKAYFNCYMADTHYRQMIKMVTGGQNWFHPQLMQEVIRRASENVRISHTQSTLLEKLTRREKQIASTVAEGLSNKEISVLLGISDRTVKAHMTSIFEKLEIKDRVALAIMMNGGHQLQKKRA
jgi:DNA-binding CsgD family transcriptional regulator